MSAGTPWVGEAIATRYVAITSLKPMSGWWIWKAHCGDQCQ